MQGATDWREYAQFGLTMVGTVPSHPALPAAAAVRGLVVDLSAGVHIGTQESWR